MARLIRKGRRAQEGSLRRFPPALSVSRPAHRAGGFSLLELVIVLTVLSILTIGVIPLVKISVKRQREQALRETLREMRTAIEQFHRDTVGGPCSGAQQVTNPAQIQAQPDPQGAGNGQKQPPTYLDPRSNVMISDCTIFGVDNPDRYPPDLETLVRGVNILPRSGGAGGYGDPNVKATEAGGGSVTEGALATKKKVYLRAIPVDPMTGEAEWDLRSSYDAKDAGSWGGENVFDVHSKSGGTALNGEKYSDW